MMMRYADIWVYLDHIEVRRHEQVLERIPLDRRHEAWGDFVLMDAAPQVDRCGWHHHDHWHRPRGSDQVLATTFAWRAQ